MSNIFIQNAANHVKKMWSLGSYTPAQSDDSFEIYCHVERYVRPFSPPKDMGKTVATRPDTLTIDIYFLVSDVAPKQGDSVSINGINYSIVKVRTNDNLFWVCAAKVIANE